MSSDGKIAALNMTQYWDAVKTASIFMCLRWKDN